MNCTQCRTHLEIEDRFCGQCGSMRPRLEPLFARIEGKYTRLRARFRAGEFSRDDYLTKLNTLTLRDETDRYWALGAESGEWYRFNDDTWIATTPPLLEAS